MLLVRFTLTYFFEKSIYSIRKLVHFTSEYENLILSRFYMILHDIYYYILHDTVAI